MKLRKNERELYCHEISGDGQYTLSELLKLIPLLQKKYGQNARISWDAGYNNVSTKILPSKTVKVYRDEYNVERIEGDIVCP